MSNWHYLQFQVFYWLVFKPNFNKRKSVLIVFIFVKECGEIFIYRLNCLFWTKINKLMKRVRNHFWLDYNDLKQLQQILVLARFHHRHLCRRLFFLFLSVSLFQKSKIIICIPFLFGKQFCFWFYLGKFGLADFQSKFHSSNKFKVILDVRNRIRTIR